MNNRSEVFHSVFKARTLSKVGAAREIDKFLHTLVNLIAVMSRVLELLISSALTKMRSFRKCCDTSRPFRIFSKE